MMSSQEGSSAANSKIQFFLHDVQTEFEKRKLYYRIKMELFLKTLNVAFASARCQLLEEQIAVSEGANIRDSLILRIEFLKNSLQLKDVASLPCF